MSQTIVEVLSLMRISGSLACASGRSREDCPYDPIYFPAPYRAWTGGWDNVNRVLRAEPVGG